MANKALALVLAAAFASNAVAKPVARAKPAAGTAQPAPVSKFKSPYPLALRDAILMQNWADARPPLEKMTAAGSLDAKVTLGQIYIRGLDGVPDVKMAEKLLGEAAASGSAAARSLLAQYYFSGVFNKGTAQYSKAWAFIYPLADAKDPMGLYLAGRILREGLLGSPNEDVGRDLILQAATRGWPDAQRELAGIGTLNLNTQSGEKDEKDKGLTGLDVLKRAADGGNIDAIWQLGLVKYYGIGTTADVLQAKSWFQKGQAKGDPASMILLSSLQNETALSSQAVAAMRRAPARAGTAYAVIARQLMDGRGVVANLETALYNGLIAGYLGSTDSFEVIAQAKAKLTADQFAAAAEKFKAWRAEYMPPAA